MAENCPRCGSSFPLGKKCQACGFDGFNTSIQQEPPGPPLVTEIRKGAERPYSDKFALAPLPEPDIRKTHVVNFGVITFFLGSAMVILWLILLSLGGLPKRSIVVAASILGGPFSLLGALFNWDCFFEHSSTRSIVDRFGRNGARVFYLLLGLFLTSLGVWFIASRSFLGEVR
jgi:hypothetical protein